MGQRRISVEFTEAQAKAVLSALTDLEAAQRVYDGETPFPFLSWTEQMVICRAHAALATAFTGVPVAPQYPRPLRG